MNVSKDIIDSILSKFSYKEDALLKILMEIQESTADKFISEETAKYIGDELKIPNNRIYEVTSFFSALNDKPKGKYHIQLCDSTVCRINKKSIIEEFLEEFLNISVGETTSDKLFTLDHTPCFGACDISPAMRINKKVYGNLTVSKTKEIISNLRGDIIE